ncbi:hypothetical protein SDC9_136064 [bioreactor metagenome]|uniref:Uncharacterized protein n=1 Tax=bioreactor metagenome TaxID=1076179 RepID=A0A645DHJ7_9ZZZZ
MGIAVALGIMAQLQGIQAVVAGDRDAAVVQCHLDEPALARALAAE